MVPGPTCFQPVKSLPLKSCLTAGPLSCAKSFSWERPAARSSIAANAAHNRNLFMNFAFSAPRELKTQIVQVRITLAKVFDRRSRFVVLHEIMLYTRFLRFREQALPINRAVANVRHVPVFLAHLAIRPFSPILHVHQ